MYLSAVCVHSVCSIILSSSAYHLQLVPACLGGMARQVRGRLAAEVMLVQTDCWEVKIHGHGHILHFKEGMYRRVTCLGGWAGGGRCDLGGGAPWTGDWRPDTASHLLSLHHSRGSSSRALPTQDPWHARALASPSHQPPTHTSTRGSDKLATEALQHHPNVDQRREVIRDVDRVVEGALRLAALVFDEVQRDRLVDRGLPVAARARRRRL